MTTIVKWNGTKILAAAQELVSILDGHPTGAFGYKVGLVFRVIQQSAILLQEQSAALIEKYQRILPGEGGKEFRMPAVQNGMPVDLSVWCRDGAAYTKERNEILAVEIDFSFPVRFSYHEVVNFQTPVRDLVSKSVMGWEGVHGWFWINLAELIDPPPPENTDGAQTSSSQG